MLKAKVHSPELLAKKLGLTHEQVIPVKADATALPFEKDVFDEFLRHHRFLRNTLNAKALFVQP